MIHIVLYEPEKPANAGNIMRTCSCFDMKLHFIGPLTYRIDKEALTNKDYLKRAAMDYVDNCDYDYYDNWQEFLNKHNNSNLYYMSRYGMHTLKECKFDTSKDIYLVFGKESTGIPKDILKNNLDHTFRIPMKAECRSLNLANCVAIVSYECLSQLDFENLSLTEAIKGKDFLLR